MTPVRTRTGLFEDGSFRVGARSIAAASAKALAFSGPQAVR